VRLARLHGLSFARSISRRLVKSHLPRDPAPKGDCPAWRRQRAPVLDLGRLAWRHDVALCPEHPQKLAELLYCDPGADPLVSKTAGRA
jgi:hypothetical protein